MKKDNCNPKPERLVQLFLEEQEGFIPTKDQANSLWEVFMGARFRFRGLPGTEESEPKPVRFVIQSLRKRFERDEECLKSVYMYLGRLNQISRPDNYKLK